MEDVVLHYQAGSAAGLSSLVERTEKLLESFPCRTPPPFTPWFPAAADLHLPIRPARAAPTITCSGDLLCESRPLTHIALNKPQDPEPDGLVAERPRDGHQAETTRPPHENPQKLKDGISETPKLLYSPEKDKDGFPVTGSPVRRSWSIFTQRRVVLQSSQSMSKQFHHLVSVHSLHLRQRAKWVISQHNCGAARDIEQVWRAVSRAVRSCRLPTCNANMQRERAEIWVFCDVLHCEQVGRLLKDELQLSGTISLSVVRLGNIFSM